MELPFAENKSTEVMYGRAVLPVIGTETGFPAGLGKEPLTIPPVSDRYLRQQQSTGIFLANQKPVLSHFDVGYVFDRLDLGKNRDLEFYLRQFLERDRHESRITQGRRHRALCRGSV